MTGSAGRVVFGATSSMSLAVLPPTMVGALAVQIRADLGFGEVALGGCTAAFFGATALTSVLGGSIAERLGARRAMVLAAAGSAGSLLAAAVLARSYAQLVALLVLGGVANGIAQPGGNLALVRGVASHRQGTAFGIKQSAVPVAVLVAGATVALLAVQTGWRSATAAVAGVGLVAVLLLTRGASGPGEPTRGGEEARLPWPGLLLLAAACCLATSAALSLSTFLVDHAVGVGLAPAAAGWLLTAGAAASVVVRLLSGWAADRSGAAPMTAAAALLLAGVAGYLLLATGSGKPALVVPAVLLALGAGWGWPAVFALSVVRYAPAAPARATGVTQAGGALGGVLGPLSFGVVAAGVSYEAAWAAAAVAGLGAAAGMAVAGRLMNPAREAGLDRRRARLAR